MRRSAEEVAVVPAPRKAPLPHDIDRGSDPARMLPSEAAALGHRVLEWTWHARRAERGLLSYAAQAFETAKTKRERPRGEHGAAKGPRRDHGPVIVCLDTSGSMFGKPGLVAKAIVAHLLLVAHEEARRCHVFSFSGPGDVVEHTLDLSPSGIEALLTFLLLDFQGGTEVSEPLRRALARHAEEDWQGADILLVSDGEFAVPEQMQWAIEKRRRESNLRVHGLLVGCSSACGTGRSTAMETLCDPLHVLGDWLDGEEDEDVRMGQPPAS
jgi:uncharacterized protein with von Willebrand factor type A (vWA) domain